MCEILNKDFDEKFLEIKLAIQRAAFIAIDTEFTGLNSNCEDHVNLFDSAKERYLKLRAHASSIIICQIGISAFNKIDDSNSYEACTYNFYICPRSQGLFDSKFLWQSSAIEFLCKYGYDFNKFAYNGLSYLNSVEEAELRKKLQNNSLFSSIKRDVDDEEIKLCCSKVANWLAQNPDLDAEFELQISLCVADYIVHKEIRSQFFDVWTYYSRDKQLTVKRVSEDERMHLELNFGRELDEKLVEQFLGFTRVFNCLLNSKKPLVGHNLLTDLVLMYNQFYKPLPKNYEEFKLDIITMFPKIYDTKHLAYNLSKIPIASLALQSTVLSNLYESLDSHVGRFLVLYSPEILHADGFLRYKSNQMHHEAGYDAYICGYVFLRLAHLQSQYNKSVEEQQAQTFNKLIQKLEPYCCNVNLIRANISHLNLRGVDPLTTRPKWLVIESRSQIPLIISEIIETCSRHGSVDVRLINPYKAMVAIASFPGARGIMKDFQNCPNIRVSSYNILQHSYPFRTCLWFLATLSTVTGIGLLYLLRRRQFF